jgi:hypothetical protein
VGLEIRYLGPAVSGIAITYTVQRRADEAFFDFARKEFRPREEIPQRAVAGKMVRRAGVISGVFDHARVGEAYIIYIHVGPGWTIKLPITAGVDDCNPANQGAEPMDPSYRAGKKFIGNKAIEARFRYTFFGNDGYTKHTATLWEDGTSSCNCPRWGPHLPGQPRRCPHSERALTLTANVDETGEQPEPEKPAGPQTTSPFRRGRRSVDT